MTIFISIFRSDEEDPSGNKYNRMDDDNIQDKERFARLVFLYILNELIVCTYVFYLFIFVLYVLLKTVKYSSTNFILLAIIFIYDNPTTKTRTINILFV